MFGPLHWDLNARVTSSRFTQPLEFSGNPYSLEKKIEALFYSAGRFNQDHYDKRVDVPSIWKQDDVDLILIALQRDITFGYH